jgi:acetyl-CoA acetyltransferase
LKLRLFKKQIGLPVFNVNNGGASGGAAVLLADALVRSGKFHCVLVVGYEKMHPG